MENQKNRVSVFVAGQRFNILTEKSEKYVMDVASEIDARINSLVLSQDMSRERAAVLTALDYADDNEIDKENLAAVKEQIKDYLHQIERLSDSNAKLLSDYSNLKAEYERLIAEHQSAEDAQKALEESQAQIASLQKENESLKEELESLKRQPGGIEYSTSEEEREAPPEKEPVITAEDDLFFDMEEEEPIKPEKKKKNRHEHNHVNPYQQKAAQKEQKGYTQQRQYSFFDIDEE